MPISKKQLIRLVRLVASLKENRYPNCSSFAAELRISELDIDFDDIVSRNAGEDSGFQARIQAMLQRQNNGSDLSLCMLHLAGCSEQIANTWIAVQTIAVQHGVNPNLF